MTAQRRYLLFSAFFDSRNPGGGAVFSMDIVRAWILEGHEVHIACARKAGRQVADLGPYLDTGRLFLHEIADELSLSRAHERNSTTAKNVLQVLEAHDFHDIHIHNFHGLLSAIEATVGRGIPVTYIPLDFGMTCFNFYRFDGSLIPCPGPGIQKCRACLHRFERMRWRDFPYRLWGILKRALKLGEGGHRKFFDLGYRKYLSGVSENLPAMLALLKKFDYVIAPSPPVERAVKEGGTPEQRIIAAVYPVSPVKVASSPNPLQDPNRPLKLIYLGNAHVVKGWPHLLEVLRTLPDGLFLEVIDAGGNLQEGQSQDLRLRRYLTASRRWPTDQVVDLIRGSDGVLVPSIWHENSPLVVIESLANGRPVIAADQDGIRHLIESGKNGLLLPPGDILGWAKALEAIARDPISFRGMQAHCHYEKSVTQYLREIEATL